MKVSKAKLERQMLFTGKGPIKLSRAAGVSTYTVKRLTGDTAITEANIETIHRLAKALGCSPLDLLEDDDAEEKAQS